MTGEEFPFRARSALSYTQNLELAGRGREPDLGMAVRGGPERRPTSVACFYSRKTKSGSGAMLRKGGCGSQGFKVVVGNAEEAMALLAAGTASLHARPPEPSN